MAQILRQSTAKDVRLGPFVDATDGVTPETGITIGAADQAEILKVDGAATVAMTGTLAAVTSCDGWYDYTLATTDVDTVGDLTIVLQDSSVCLPVFARFMVVEEAVYDAFYAAASTPIAITDIVSSGAITTSGGIASADVKKINATTIVGNGSAPKFGV